MNLVWTTGGGFKNKYFDVFLGFLAPVPLFVYGYNPTK